ncbi:TPA: hypothetical protein IW781_002126 [Enterococcus faecium]|nr:hypothetical protein [Enterococcus faecium]HAQ1200738.1 hypothetical protein [Enterococcus faecium]HAQ1311367.1 hypothetical protein [Enterococcus faecium]HBJ6034752.1 hypothetical protein [Enterococcus faecium]
MKSAGKARNNGLYRHIRTSKEIIRNLLNDLAKDNIKKYKKGNIFHIDIQISSNLEDIKKAFKIKTIGTAPNFK